MLEIHLDCAYHEPANNKLKFLKLIASEKCRPAWHASSPCVTSYAHSVRSYSKFFIDNWFAFFKNNFEPTLRGTADHVDINVIKSWYQLPAAEQFLKLCNQNRKGLLFIRAISSGDCPRAETYFSRGEVVRAGAAIAAQRASRVVLDRNRECCVLKIARTLLKKQTFTLEGAQQYRKERRRHWSAMNTCLVPGCGKTFRSERGLISHTEAVHGRDNVHRGMRAWERSRQQQGAVTVGEATEHNQEWDLEGEDFEI